MSATKTFYFTKQTNDSEHILKLEGDLDLSVASELAEELKPLINEPMRILILDLQGLNYIDSTGIGIIVSTLKARSAMDAAFFVTNIPPKIKRLFDLTGITRYMIPMPGQNS